MQDHAGKPTKKIITVLIFKMHDDENETHKKNNQYYFLDDRSFIV